MGIRLRLFVILLGCVLVIATFTYPLWRPAPAGVQVAEAGFPELTEEQQQAYSNLPLNVQRAYTSMRQMNAPMAVELLTARLQPTEPLPPEEQELPPVDTAVIAARGEFVPLMTLEPEEDSEDPMLPFRGIYTASGEVTIYRFPDNTKLLRFEDLNLTNGPNLRILLSTNPAPLTREDIMADRDRIDIGGLRTHFGSQNYTSVPVEINIANYRSVVIYNNTYGIVYAVAPIS